MSCEQRLEPLLATYQARARRTLDHWIPTADTHPRSLHAAMRYAALSGGKYVRPVLVYAAGEALGANHDRLDTAAAAVEMIHAYSLIHDDLPAMDDDALRRGQPTCHIQFGEAMAILAGDALQALAFYILAHDAALTVSAERRLKMLETLGLACGSRGMAGGQAIDLAAVGKTLSLLELEDMHIHKTGALIRASVLLGAYASGAEEDERFERLDHYGKCIGLAFQIRDDILDEEGETDIIGKQQGADRALGKPTYPALLGVQASRERAHELADEAISSLSALGSEADPLRWLAQYIVDRLR